MAEAPKTIRNIALVGFMGTGKSRLGRMLAKKLRWRHLDSDAIIERREGKAIASIFKARGESYFRSIESRVVKDLLLKPQVVLSLGGGAVCRKVNRTLIKKRAFVIWLKSSPEVIYRRTSRSQSRPLLCVDDPREKILDLLKEREPYYRRCSHAVIDNDGGPALAQILKIEQVRRVLLARPVKAAA